MGIGKFHKWLYHAYPDCFNKINSVFYDYVYIDINCILHRIVSGSINENILFGRFYSYIDNLLKNNIPTKQLIFAIDGAAPFAKIILQRKRRLKISRNIGQQNDTLNIVGPLHFTPGTKFMKSLPEKISKYIKKIELAYKIKVDILVGSGEAEFKLIRKLLDITKIKNNGNHLLVSTDADIIIMVSSIMNDNIKNIYVNNLKYVISIDKLLQLHKGKVGLSNNSNKDFMLVSLMMGNDYLPKLNYVNPDKLWDAYIYSLRNDDKGCFIGNNLNYNFLLNLLRNIIVNLSKQWLSQFHIDDYDPNMYKNYLDGLRWCTEIYVNGLCEQTEYMYTYDLSPHPFGLLFYLESNINKLKGSNNDIKLEKNDVPDDVYGILILPKSSLHLLDEEYSKKIDNKLDFLYDEELCERCIGYHKVLGDYHRKIANSDDIGKNNIRKEIGNISVQMVNHKRKHKDISIEEIIYVIKCLIN